MSEVIISNISKSFRGQRIIDGISLNIKSGDFVSIVGKYGTGKTTLLKLIAGLVTVDDGSISIDGERPEELLKSRKIGFAFQDPSLLAWRDVLGNVSLPLEINHDTSTSYAKKLIKTVNLDNKISSKPNELSGGMQRIVSILRALVLRPSVLMLDEPFSSIDEISRSDLHEKLISIHNQEKLTTLMVTHSIEEAVYLSDMVLVLGGKPAKIIKTFKIKSPRQIRHKYSSNSFKQIEEIRKTIAGSM